jgi:hypothetical protein
MKNEIYAKPLSKLILLFISLLTSPSFAQLTGIKSIPVDYSTIASAVSALNSQGVGSGGVTFNVSAGYTETLTARLNLTATGTSSNPIIFQKNGTGNNPKITAYAGNATPASATPDGIWSFQGSDYVTINGIDLFDPNTTNPATMEYGYGFFRNTAYDGAQYNTVENCTVTLNRVNNVSGTSPMVDGSVCILVINSTPTAATSAFAPFIPAGTNSHNKFYSNVCQNCNYGIVLTGSIAATPFDLGDNGNDIGGSLTSTGNTILNFGGGVNYNPAEGIRATNQWEVNISHNTLNNNNGSGSNPAGYLYGINAESGLSANATLCYNTISLSSNSGYDVYGLYNAIGSTPASNVININNNTITNCTVTTGSPYLFCLYNNSNAATVNINYNTISNITHNSGAVLDGILTSNTSMPVNLNVGNNTISHLTKNGTSSSKWIYLIELGGQYVNCHDNEVDNVTITGSGSGVIYGLFGNILTSVTENYSNNSMHDFDLTGTTAGSTIYSIYSNCSGTVTVQNNQLYNYSLNSNGQVTGIYSPGQIINNQVHDIHYTGAGTIYGIQPYGSGSMSNNTIYALSNLTGTTGSISGICANATGTFTIYKNSVSNLYSANTSATIDGITLGSGTKYVYNNFISDLRTPNSASTSAITGIDINAAGTFDVYYNSIYMNANSTGATFGTSAIYANTSATLDLRNNNLVNTSIPNGGGYTCAYRRSNTTLTTYSNLSNNNNFYAGTPGLYKLIFYDGTNSDQTLPGYKTRVLPRDAASVTENPPYINTTTEPFDLHLSTSIPTQCESHGTRITTPIAVGDDYDGDIRQGEAGYSGTGVGPDIGADEGNFVLNDVDPPVMAFPTLGNSCTSGNRILIATITDISTVPVSGSYVPRIYYKKNSGTWYSQPGTLSSGTGLNGSWSFVIVTTDMGGLVVGDIVSYYLIAQDQFSSFNIGSNPSAGIVATNVNNVITPPTTPDTYTVLTTLAGVYMVGAGQTFATLTAAAAVYNNPTNCLGMGVVFELTDATYSSAETFPIVFNSNPFAGPGNTLTIRPANGVTATISGSSGTAIIKFNGAKYITLDGSNSGGTDMNMFITNTYNSGSPVAVWVGSTGTGAGSTNITIKNCALSTGTSCPNTSYGIFAGSTTTLGSPGDDNDNLVIQNNSIYKAFYGISVVASSTGVDDNLQVIQNSIGSSTAANYITNYGIQLSYVSGATISKNTIFNIIASSTSVYGMSVGTGVVSSSFSKNYIRTVQNTSSAVSKGIYVNTGNAASNLTFSNNVVCEILGSPGTTISNTNVGIFIDGTTGGLNIYFNSISIYGSNTTSSNIYSAALLLNSATITGINMKDNILKNADINNMSGTSSRNYAIYTSSAAAGFTDINYNDYYPTGTQGAVGYMGADKITLAAWQAATGKDANSLVTDPLFISTNDLRPGIGSLVLGAGVTISGFPDDFLNVTRNSPPAMGAYEYGVDVIPPAITFTPLVNTDSTSSRNLVATITDASGIPVSGTGLPVLYWKINSGSWQAATGVYLGGNGYHFNFGSGVNGGDMVYYYVAAQDQATPVPNVICNPSAGGGGFGYNPPAASTPPTTPNSYKVLIDYNGTIIVGNLGPFPNLTGNSGLFKALNENQVTGNITAWISSDLVEGGENALNQWIEYGGSGFTLTIRPLNKYDVLISGSAAGLIRLNGAARVTITGEYPGVGNFLTFRNTSNNYPVFTFQADAAYDTLENLTIEGCNTAPSSGDILFYGSSGGNGNKHIMILNNIIRDRSDLTAIPAIAIYSSGLSPNSDNTISGNQIFNFQGQGIYIATTGNGSNWTITGNHIFNTFSASTYQTGIFFYAPSNSNGNLISGNYIGGSAPYCGGTPWLNSNSSNFQGIFISGGSGTGTSVQGNTIQNIDLTSAGSCTFNGIGSSIGFFTLGTVTGNTIGSLSAPGSITIAGTGDVTGISLGTSSSATVRNSIISNIVQTAANPGKFQGIYLGSALTYTIDANLIMNCGATSSSTGVKDNTGIFYAGAALGTQPCAISNNLISLGHGITNNNVYKGIDDFGYSGNNVFLYFNSIYLGGTCNGSSNSYGYLKRDVTNETHKNNIYYNSRTGGTGKQYAFGVTAVAGTFISNYNDLFTTAAPLAIWNITDQADINAWRTASGQDANSKSINPGFLSITDLHPTAPDLDAAGNAVSGITTDYAGVERGNPPDIGAYEFAPGPKTWNGSTSTDWNIPLNWTPTGVPSAGVSVIIPSGTPNSCIVNSTATVCNNMILDGSTFTINTGFVITVSGNLTIQNNATLINSGTLTVNGNLIKN